MTNLYYNLTRYFEMLTFLIYFERNLTSIIFSIMILGLLKKNCFVF